MKFLIRDDGETVMLNEMGNIVFDTDGNFYTKLGNGSAMDSKGNYYRRIGSNMVTNMTTGETHFYISGLDDPFDKKDGKF